MQTINDSTNQIRYFVGDSSVEKLKALLRAPEARDFEAERAAAIQAAHERVDAAAPFAAMSARAERATTAGAEHAALVERQRADLKPGRFTQWNHDQEEAYAAGLIAETKAFDAEGARVRALFPRPGMPTPATVVAALNRSDVLQALAVATPEDAETLVDDVIVLGDQPTLALAAIAVRGFLAHKNAYQTGDGTAAGERMLQKIAAAASTDADAARYAEERAAEYRQGWAYLINHLLHSGGTIDPVERAAGALAPLLWPVAPSSPSAAAL